MAYVVEKGVPMPNFGRKPAYPFAQMEAGDSFRIVADERNRVASAASWWSKRHSGVRFALRKDGDGVRVWRTK